MPNESLRSLRLRWDDLRDAGSGDRPRPPALDPTPSRGALRFLGRVVDGGAIPTATGRIFLLNPATLSGPQDEGQPASMVVDGSRKIPVAVIGSIAPKVGDLLVAFSIGGRWTAIMGDGDGPISCQGCPTPRRNLTLSWANSFVGPGSVAMTFDGGDTWSSGCVNQLRFSLTCRDGLATFLATYFTGGPCPAGQPLSCGSPGSAPLGLMLTQQTCSPFVLQYSVTSATCPSLAAQGYTRFTITI